MATKRKLTLSVDEKVIERAHRYSRRHDTSISRLVTSYLRRLDSSEASGVSPLVRRLWGVLHHDTSLEEYRQHLEEKHGS